MIGALCYKINENAEAKLYLAGSYNEIDWDDERLDCCLGRNYSVFPVKNKSNFTSFISIEPGIDEKYMLRLVETKRYIIKIEADNTNIVPRLPRFQNEGNKFLKCDRDENTVTFQFVNYLGRSRIIFGEGNEKQILFEIIPEKMGFEDDYISLTEALAQACSDLLLDYSGITSNLFSQKEDDPKTLFEQFIFLRKFCYDENIQSLFGEIRGNPDRMLLRREELKPFGSGVPSSKFYINPIAHSKYWQKIEGDRAGIGGYAPRMISIAQKYDSIDTVANRFVKHAFEKFDDICSELIRLSDEEGSNNQIECLNEARFIHEMLNDILRNDFFKEISPLNLMPQNNQVLQKREGYSQIFSAYAMVEMASCLDWKGMEDVYEGESKNVALLYEYWLFFELYKIIEHIDGCEIIDNKEKPFIKSDENNLTIFLEQGKQSCQSFKIQRLGVKINLYYNRTFFQEEFDSTRYEGSYSRPFRPDYTIAIFPNVFNTGKYNGEKLAISNGAVKYIHFDAKYRVSKVEDLIGSDNGVSSENELLLEKEESVVNTYKRGDLLKMHTYNDAIRRTTGSYVLYPGNSDHSSQKKFRLYDEILPGVGAFAIRPGKASNAENVLKNFLTQIIEFQGENYSRLNRMQYYAEMVISEPTVSISNVLGDNFEEAGQKTYTTKKLILGYIRPEYYDFLVNNGLLKVGSNFLFYFYAIKDGFVYSHHKDIAKAKEFCFYKNNIDETGTYRPESVLCFVESYELISKEDLVKKLKALGYDTDETRHNADFYYTLNLRVKKETGRIIREYTIAEINSMNGNDSFSPHSPKVIDSINQD